MPLVYHLKPKNLVGSILYPLNRLRDDHPTIYAQHAAKYAGREPLLERLIPILNCLWNDVLFFSPVHPELIKAAYIDVGKIWSPAQWVEIDTVLHGFNAGNTVIYEPDMQREKGDFTIAPDRVTPFAAENIVNPHMMPQANLDYYREAVQRNERIMLWRGLTHILHRGEISLDRAQLFEL